MIVTKLPFKLKYFNFDEIKCRHCETFDLTNNSKEFLYLLDDFREFLGYPLSLTNLYRCPIHNADVGSGSGSAHIKAIAADCYNFEKGALDIFTQAKEYKKFNGIGIYPDQNFVHIDIKIRTLTPKLYWVKYKDEAYKYFSNFREAIDYMKKR
jgi:uncharacterized protein YcbK (DUF882 family)